MSRKKPQLDTDILEQMLESSEYYISKYPKLAELYSRLMIAGGKYIQLDPMDSAYWVDRLLQNGEYIRPEIVSYVMSKRCKLKPFLCYSNLIRVLSKRPAQKMDIYIGYSLMTLENCWLQHVWMYDGKIIYETTPIESSQYFGIPVSLREFDRWMNDYRWKLPQGGYMGML